MASLPPGNWSPRRLLDSFPKKKCERTSVWLEIQSFNILLALQAQEKGT
jgi:hypothetical protein